MLDFVRMGHFGSKIMAVLYDREYMVAGEAELNVIAASNLRRVDAIDRRRGC